MRITIFAMIIIRIRQQRLYHRRKTGVWYSYAISSAQNGSGNQRNSFRTPLGKHRIYQKIGADMPAFTAFLGRKAIGLYRPMHHKQEKDWILSRILWLDGMQTGINKRGAVDSKHRYIYIHGTHAEDAIGTPVSHGCIRMRNYDIIDLFNHVQPHEIVNIHTH